MKTIDDLMTIVSNPTDKDRAMCTSLYQLAKSVSTGAIFEIGVYYGLGVISLCLGAMENEYYVPVFTVDSMSWPRGWVGGKVEHPKLHEYYRVIDAGTQLMQLERNSLFIIGGEVSDVAHEIIMKATLLVWDTEIGDRKVFFSWERTIPLGGIVALYCTGKKDDTLYNQLLGEYSLQANMPGDITVLRKESEGKREGSNVSALVKN